MGRQSTVYCTFPPLLKYYIFVAVSVSVFIFVFVFVFVFALVWFGLCVEGEKERAEKEQEGPPKNSLRKKTPQIIIFTKYSKKSNNNN